ncbi:zinc finger MYM-type 1-like [Paramuricea clavata]|uniref:Zinc finger MYM-type 1-like n=1 Tax=Paramuricea clavata TaxID=317549 RepID=A0A6S7GEH2_PARCT|nr:zinc finger MYM-type 1-like [Paramuricea clavata]
MSNEMKKDIKGSRFVFKEARAPRNKPSRRLQALIGESTFTNIACVTTPKTHHRINTFYLSLDKVLSEMKSRFHNNNQEILCVLGDVVLNDSPLENSFDAVAEFYNVDRDLLKWRRDGLCDLLPVLYEAATILASIPATSCTAERSFSGLRRVKTYLRSTMGEEHLNSIAVINIERAYANRTIKNDMVKIIDTFGRRNGRVFCHQLKNSGKFCPPIDLCPYAYVQE